VAYIVTTGLQTFKSKNI